MLVAAVLGPQEREDGELEVVRISPEQGANSVLLPVREAEGSMEWLCRDTAQGKISLDERGDALGRKLRAEDVVGNLAGVHHARS